MYHEALLHKSRAAPPGLPASGASLGQGTALPQPRPHELQLQAAEEGCD